MTRVTVPQIDANIVDVTVTAWHKQVGDRVVAGEIVAELTTDKATFDLESPAEGTLLTILAATKSIVPAGYILALLGAPGECDPEAAAVNAGIMAAYRPKPRVPAPSASAPSASEAPACRVRATPKARRLAQAHGIDLARVQAETGAEVVTEAALAPYLPGAERT